MKKQPNKDIIEELNRFVLVENLEYAAKYAPDGFKDIANIRKAVLMLLRAVPHAR